MYKRQRASVIDHTDLASKQFNGLFRKSPAFSERIVDKYRLSDH